MKYCSHFMEKNSPNHAINSLSIFFSKFELTGAFTAHLVCLFPLNKNWPILHVAKLIFVAVTRSAQVDFVAVKRAVQVDFVAVKRVIKPQKFLCYLEIVLATLKTYLKSHAMSR